MRTPCLARVGETNFFAGLITSYGPGIHRFYGFRVFIGAEGRGRGLGSEATELIVRHGFHELGLHLIALEVYAFNPSARNVDEKVGCRYEGTDRDALWFGEQWIDVDYMSILETDTPLDK